MLKRLEQWITKGSVRMELLKMATLLAALALVSSVVFRSTLSKAGFSWATAMLAYVGLRYYELNKRGTNDTDISE